MKKAVALFLIQFLILIAGCQDMTQESIEELKGEIPDLKVLLAENLELFEQVDSIFKSNDTGRSFRISKYPSGAWRFYVSKEDGGGGLYESEETFENTTLLSEDEKEKIERLFQLSENGISISSIGSDRQFGISYRNLVDLRMIHIDDAEQDEFWHRVSAYVEELSEDWYACIIVSRGG